MKQAFKDVAQGASLPELDFTNPNNLFDWQAKAALIGRNLTEQAMDPALSPEKRAEILQAIKDQFEALAQFSVTLDALARANNNKAMTDPLTGVYNRAGFNEIFPRLIEISKAQGKPLAVLALDLDKFKAVNDIHGHASGDAVLKIFGSQIQKNVKGKSDIAARIGGEEFVAVLPGASLEQAMDVAQRLRQAVSARREEQQGNVVVPAVTVSIGLATLQDGDDASSLLQRADKALYAAKSQGRDRVVHAPLTLGDYSKTFQP